MRIPLFVLAVGSVLAGYPFLDIFAGHGAEGFFGESLAIGGSNTILETCTTSAKSSPRCRRCSCGRFAVAWLF